MAQSDLNTTAIEELTTQVQDNEALLTALTNFVINISNDSLLDSLNDILEEAKKTNAYLQIIVGDELIETDGEDMED